MALAFKHSRRNERGFTLLELMYAFGYFMLGIAGLTFFHSVAATNTQRASDISIATMITGGTIEELRANPNAVVPSTNVVYWDRFGNSQYDPNGVSNPNYNGTAYFTVTTATSTPAGAYHYYDVTVQTNWYQLPMVSFQHGVVMQTRVPTD